MQLNFQRDIFAQVVSDNCLLVMAKGLGMDIMLNEFITLYNEETNLVFLLNHVHPEIPFLDSSVSPEDRQAIYSRGGVIAITNRILVIDMLTERVPKYLITGILVCAAEKVKEFSTEAFILRQFRDSNDLGFIKCFSTDPQAFVGLNQIEKKLKFMEISQIYLWPRFHKTVDSDLSFSPDVIEIQCPLTKSMKMSQVAILQIIEACITELRKRCPSYEDELVLDRVIVSSLNFLNEGYKVNAIKKDIRLLVSIMQRLVDSTAEDYLEYIQSLFHEMQQGKIYGSDFGWIGMKSVDTVFKMAKLRVEKGEVLPKIKTFVNIVGEVREEFDRASVLVVTSTQQTCMMLAEHLRERNSTLDGERIRFCSESELSFYSLRECNPSIIILFDANVSFIRIIEVYQATIANQLRVYFLIYKDSVEEQRFLTSIRTEKNSFETLIKAKSRMTILKRDIISKEGTIVIDSREFRSTLPYRLYKHFNIIPSTIEVGDYILSPEICVERKSIPDLIASFQSGRLATQIDAMSKTYKQIFLLLELETLSDIYLEIIQKLCLLCLKYPMLKLIWSSVENIPQYFQDLKRYEDDPTEEQAKSVEYNLEVHDLLLKMAGINEINVRYVLQKYENLKQLAIAPEDELIEVLGEQNGKELYRFLSKEV